MSSQEEIRAERMKKLEQLTAAGVDPYPANSERTHALGTVLDQFTELRDNATVCTVAGRVLSIRRHGGSAFADLYDNGTTMQIFFARDAVGADAFSLFVDTIDPGDFIECTGTVFYTKRDAPALQPTTWRILSKSLQAIPDTYYGLQDDDERYRKRYLDFILNEESRNIVRKRARFWKAVRDFHHQHGFLEVQTPVLETTTGGGDARPFQTHHHSLDMDVYLRISAGELWQKRLMVAGFEKTFEVGRVFRNEGISAEHAQDYEQCEAYWAYADMRQMATFMRKCYQYVAQETFGTLQFTIRDFTIDLSGEWPELDYVTAIETGTGINIWQATDADMQTRISELGLGDSSADNRNRMIDTLWKYCRRQIGGPVILVNEPTEMSPLAKKQAADQRLVERFHFVIAGSEVGQGYSELNDPIDQRARFLAQQNLRDAGDDEAQMADMDFVEALEYGMPPTAGHGFSERLLAFLLDVPMREAQLFPLMKPKSNRTNETE